MKTLIVMMLWTYSALSSEVFNSLSCSDKTLGTQIFYINGEMIDETGKHGVGNTSRLIRDLITDNDNKKRIDQNEKVFVEYLYNHSEPLGLDYIQLIAQKIEEGGEIADVADIAKFIFKRKEMCFLNPIVCGSISLGLGKMLKMQRYMSKTDITLMTNHVIQHLNYGYKVIVVSHSQGSLYANYVYDELRNRGVKKSELDKYFGNLQVASAASYVRAKNHKTMTAKQDRFIQGLGQFYDVLSPNYSFIKIDETMDKHNHEMIQSYLSDLVEMVGPRQGKGVKTRKASDVFIDNLEEVAWMLANNDESCCNGLDGRMYRKDYDSDPQAGFLEKTVKVEKGVNIEIDKQSQICGFVNIYSSSEDFKIKLIDSKITGYGPIHLKGNLLFQFSKAESSFVPEKPLRIEGTSHLPLTFQNASEINGNLDISGSLVADKVKLEGTGIIKGSMFHDPLGPIEWHAPAIIDVKITGNSNIQGYYVIRRDLKDTTIVGTRRRRPNGWYDLTNIEYHSESINNGIIKGFVLLAGRVDNNVTIEGNSIGESSLSMSGINISPTSRIRANSNLKGAAYIDKTDFSGVLNANSLDSSATYVTHFYDAQITSNVSGYVQIYEATINGGSVSGNPIITNSMLTNPTVSCNANIFFESVSNKIFGCNYVSEYPLPKKIDYFDKSRQEMNYENQAAILEWDNWMINKQKEISDMF